MTKPDPEEDGFRRLDLAFELAVGRQLEGDGRSTLLFSGGVDSTLLALELGRRAPFEALVLGTPGSPDIDQARTAAARIGIALREVVVTDREIEPMLGEDRGVLAGLREPARSVQIALALAVASSATRRVLASQGADELFGGYAHFRGLDPTELERRRSADLRKLLDAEWPFSRALAERRGHDLRSPFLDAQFIEVAGSFPLEAVGESGLTKPGLRRWAVHRGVPRELAMRPKRAMQYGSGIARSVRRWPAGPEA